ncbi:hypothetical protein F5148DRAFT_1204346 [Russula earlei]|uniref:Uncharacterized protein n=1 Tax=Russula earlei TaxID=71964 RepID=A0ACC0U7B5_9AGAM|nr:hypothetical protein F5148DRAFT_1204346 [Russula earlei]
MFDIDIDWTTEEDRLHRRRKASTIHGWLRMWRGTLAGNEKIRQQGRREMKEARALRTSRRKHPEAAGGSSNPFSFFPFGNRRAAPVAAPAPQRHRSTSSKHHRGASRSHSAPPRPTPAQRKSSSGARHGHHRAGHGHAPAKPEPTRHHKSRSSKSKPREFKLRQSSGRR